MSDMREPINEPIYGEAADNLRELLRATSGRIEWVWRDEGSGSGHMQKVIVYDTRNMIAEAYTAFTAHWADGFCGECAESPVGRCSAAEPLWRAYKRAREA
jgi:hypothetical protein